jgi:glyoxylase-like metal-dependent hydrolase (beta-lactamase superfamily II)
LASVIEVEPDLFLIDTEMYSIPGYTSVYLVRGEKSALIDVGLPTSATTILEGLDQVGLPPNDIAYIIPTHVHLDHAGGAGALASHMPQAQVLAHGKAAKHLVDPTRLMASVGQVAGGNHLSQDGTMLPIDPARVQAVSDGDVLELGTDHELRILYSPGHAPHHLCIYDTRYGALFAGDAVGIFFPEEEILLPATPPPSFDLDMAVDTIARLREEDIGLLLFSHFGATRKVQETFDKATALLHHWGNLTRTAAERNNLEEAISTLRVELRDQWAPLGADKRLYEYQEQVILPISAAGYVGHFRRKLGLT